MDKGEDWRDELPRRVEGHGVEQILEHLANGRPSHAAAVLEWIGGDLSPSKLTALLRSRGRGSWMEREEAPQALALCDALIGRGADPFEAVEEAPGKRGEWSFFEGILRGGLWSYASKIALASEDSKAKAAKALERLDEGGAWRSGKLRVLADGGAAGVALGLALGVDPDAKLSDGRQTPWALMLSDPAAIEALGRAGAQVNAPDKHGLTLEEKIGQMPGGKARQALLDAFARAGEGEGAGEGAGFKEGAKALEAVARDGSFKELSKLALAVGEKLREARGPSGWGLLETALLSANWSLALKMMEEGEADAKANSGMARLPIGALALWGASSARRLSKANENAKERCLAKALEAAWEVEPGLLELAMAARREGMVARKKEGPWRDADAEARSKMERLVEEWDARACCVLFEKAPLSVDKPLWARARDAGMSQEQVGRAAIAKLDEQVVDGAGRFLWTAAAIDLEKGAGWMRSGAKALMEGLERRPLATARTLCDAALEQAWEEFWVRAKEEGGKDVSEGRWRAPAAREMASSMGWALRKRARPWNPESAPPGWSEERLAAAWAPGLAEGWPLEEHARGWVVGWAREATPAGHAGEGFVARLALELIKLGSVPSLLAADELAREATKYSSMKVPGDFEREMEAAPEPAGEAGRLAWSTLCEAAGIDAERAREAKIAREAKLARSRRL